MPLARATDWDKVRVKCSVIGCLRPGLVSVQSEPQEVDLDEDLLHWDAIYSSAMAGLLSGQKFDLSLAFVPHDLHRPNSVFWITVGNDGLRRLYRRSEDEIPAVIGPETAASIEVRPSPLSRLPHTKE